LQPSIEKVYGTAKEASQERPTINDLREELEVKLLPATNILEISYENSDPEIAINLINTIAQTMVEKTKENIRSEAKSLREFLETEVAQQRKVVAQTETAENQYRQENGLVSVDNQTNNLVNSIDKLEDQEQTLLAQIKEKKSQVEQLQRTVNVDSAENAYVGGRIGQDRELEELRAKLEQLEAKLASANSYLTEQNPTYISLKEERDSVRSLYQEKLSRVLSSNQTVSPGNIAGDELSQDLISRLVIAKTELSALENKLGTIKTEKVKLENRLSVLPTKIQPLTELVRQRQEANESLKFLQRKLEEARIAEAQLFSDLEVVELAEIPDFPTSPNVKVVLAVAIAAALVLSFGSVLLLESLDGTLQDAFEVEQKLQLPILGVPPYLPPSAVNLEYSDEFLYDPSLVEPYRLLLRNLEARAQGKLKLLVVSSTIAGEGKSVVASHLAAVSAMLSRRTLIIDADLRRPKQHLIFGLDSHLGLSDIIEGNLNWTKAVKTTKVDNLSVITCGQLPTMPSLVLESAAMKSLLKEISYHYDFIILDTPPVSSCADAHSVSQQSDGLVMVTRPHVTPKDVLARAVSELKRSGIPILGFVTNGITSQTDKYYRYAYEGYGDSQRYLGSSMEEEDRGAKY
jgi:capsular exopolysaccharide synthesis family protein